jgi:hypothetical protein
MKIKVFTLAITAIAICVVAAQPSMAQDKPAPHEGMNRFPFAMNKWKMEQGNRPGGRMAIPQNQYAVGHGSMPGKSMLIDPAVLTQAKQQLPPMTAPSQRFGQPVVTPTMMAAAPQVMAQPKGLQAPPAPAFNPAFGKQREETPMVANAPQVLPPVANSGQSHESVSGKLTPGRHRGSPWTLGRGTWQANATGSSDTSSSCGTGTTCRLIQQTSIRWRRLDS